MRRQAFTLVEILVGMAIMVVLSVSLFRVFGSANRANVQSVWYTRSQSQARSLLSQIRNDLGQATCPSTVTDGDIVRDAACGSTYALAYKSGVTDLTAATPETKLLEFTVATPDINTTALIRAGTQVTCVLRAFGRTLNYTRTVAGAGAPILKAMNKDMMDDVKSVTIEVRSNLDSVAAADQASYFDQEGHVVDIILDVKHANEGQFPNAFFQERTTARAPVPANAI